MAERDVAASRALQVGWWPGPETKLDKAVRAALLRRSRDAPGLKKGIKRPRTRSLRVLAIEPVAGLRATRAANAQSGEWLVHDLDDGNEVAWGYRPDGVRDILPDNRWPESMDAGDAATIVVVTWPDDLAASGYETPSYDLALTWTGGGCTISLPPT